MSSGTKSTPSSDSEASGLPGTQDSFETEVARAIRALNDADVAVYPVDARGIQVAAPFQANRASFGKRNKPPRGASPVDSGYETMESLAEETGGRAFHHINDLNTAIQAAAADSRVTYSLAFYFADAALDESYHRIEVSVDRPGVTLRYRPGYLATRKTAVAPSLADAIVNPVNLTGIGLTARLDPVDGGYKISVTIDPRDLTITENNGKFTGALQFLVVVGKVEQLTTVPLNFTEEVFRRIQTQGLTTNRNITRVTIGCHHPPPTTHHPY